MAWITHDGKLVDELMYLEICRREYRLYRDTYDYASELKSSASQGEEDVDGEWGEALLSYRESGLITIVFAAMSLEALINRYAAVRTSATYFRKYLDKLDVVSKWLLIPKLVTGKSIETDSQPFEQLRRLFRYRNRVVHYKAVSIADDWRTDEVVSEFHSEVQNAIEVLFSVPSELRDLDADFFQDYDFYDLESTFNEELKSIIAMEPIQRNDLQ